MNDLSGKNIVLLCPRFFDYEKEIKSVLENLGANVIWFDDRPSNDFFSKAIIRVNKNFLSRKIDAYYERIINEISKTELQIDYILFVNPESINVKSIDLIKKTFSKGRLILYMWDSFRNRKKNIELLPFFNSKFTFDPKDVEDYGLEFRPLFFIDKYMAVEKKAKYDLLFIGTAHSDRYQFVKRILSDLNYKLIAKTYFFLSSKLLFLVKKLTDKDFRAVKYKDVSFKSLSHVDNADLMSQSMSILDVNHPQQIGLTMRTFETLGAQRKLITTNQDIKNYDFYNENNILVVDRKKPVIGEEFFLKPFEPYSSEMLFKYSIHGWISSLFNLK
jgi:hypothetical protein